MRTKFNSLSTSALYKFNANSIADSSWVSKFKHYYIFTRKSNSMEPAQLTPNHFTDKLYKNVLEGSQRWWILELRKSDYEFISKGKFSNTTVRKYEDEWQRRISEWYFTHDTGLKKEDTTSIGKAERVSHYKLKKNTGNIDVIGVEDAVKIGLDDIGAPRFYRIIKDHKGEICDVDMNIRLEDLRNVEGLTKFSARWWTLERMRYDWGNDYHPIATDFGMLGGDWKGIIYKWMNNINCINGEEDIVKYHERGWIQWVQANYASYKEMKDDEVKKDSSAFNHNWNIISRMNNKELLELAQNCPEYILTHMPPKLYAQAIFQVISLLDSNKRIDKSSMTNIAMLCKNILPAIKTYATTPTGCKNINITHVSNAIAAIEPKGSLNIARIISVKIAQYNMLSTKMVGMLSTILDSIYVYPIRRDGEYDTFDNYLNKKGISQFEWYSKHGSLNDMIKGMDDNFNETKLKYELL